MTTFYEVMLGKGNLHADPRTTGKAWLSLDGPQQSSTCTSQTANLIQRPEALKFWHVTIGLSLLKEAPGEREVGEERQHDKSKQAWPAVSAKLIGHLTQLRIFLLMGIQHCATCCQVRSLCHLHKQICVNEKGRRIRTWCLHAELPSFVLLYLFQLFFIFIFNWRQSLT